MIKGSKHTEETKAKMRGKVKSPETRAKISAKMKGRPLSEAHRKVVGAKKGVAQSKEHVRRRSEALKEYNRRKKNG